MQGTPRGMENANANQPWLVPNMVVVSSDIHDVPKHPKDFLPKFDTERKESPKFQIKKFMLLIRILNVQYEDVVCKMFTYTFKGKSSTWYFRLAQASFNS